jgi:hypothetical protein
VRPRLPLLIEHGAAAAHAENSAEVARKCKCRRPKHDKGCAHSLDYRAVAHTHDEIDQVAKTIAASVEAMTPSRATLARRVAWFLTDLGSRRTGGHARSGDPAVYKGTFKDPCVMDWTQGQTTMEVAARLQVASVAREKTGGAVDTGHGRRSDFRGLRRLACAYPAQPTTGTVRAPLTVGYRSVERENKRGS